MDQTPPHVVFLPSPGMGHLIPMAEFAKLLVQRHHFSATIAVPISGPPTKPQKQVLEALPESVNYIFLPPVHLPEGISSEVQTILTINLSLPSLRDTMASLNATTRLVSLVVDPFGLDAFDVAKEFGVSKYLLFPTNAMCLSFCFYLPKLDETTTCQYRDLPQPIQLPGCVPLLSKDLLDPVQDRTHEGYKGLLANMKRFMLADGIILNSFLDLEKEAIEALWDDHKQSDNPPIYPVGPIIQTGSTPDTTQPECLTWLDGQPSGSVLFVSFGSGGTLSSTQINELALGLELSGQKFLWVVRAPNDKLSNGAFFDARGQHDPLSYLPEGFLDRTKEQGFVVPSWAPQIEVLSHGSVGGFVTHCGWNSTLEGIVHGVPLIAWPLYAEQKMNATMLTKGIDLALSLKKSEDGVVEKEEIAKVVRDLMEKGGGGAKVHQKMRSISSAAKKVLSEDGSSTKSLSDLASVWRKLKI